MRLVWRLRKLLEIETELWAQGYTRVAGVDEVGVGPLAGPVVAAAVVFRPGCGIRGVDDSKRLLPEQRERMGEAIRREALSWAVAEVAPADIDRLNIYQAAREAMRLAVAALPEPPDYVIVDARTVPGCELPQRAIVGGDARCHAIAAASILAKLTRDAAMVRFDTQYPGYGFADHKGYATLSHRQALARLGPCDIHRRSFTPCVQGSLWDLEGLALGEECQGELERRAPGREYRPPGALRQ